jgi:putative MATE family efflux protein
MNVRAGDPDSADRMGSAPLGPLIARFSLPVIVMMVAGSLYNLADRVFVGRGVGQDALAGVTVAFPLFILLYSIGLLFGLGAASLISLSLGRSDRALAERAVGNALAASLCAAIPVIVLGYFFMDPLLRLFGGEGRVLLEARKFCSIFLAGSLFQVMTIVLSSTIRAEGDPATALAANLTGIGINILLNPLFIFALKLGIAGSALATTTGELVSCLWLLIRYLRGASLLHLRRDSLRLDLRVLKKIGAIGFAPFLAQLALCLMMALSNRAASSYGGTEGIACMGILYVIYPLILQPLAGIAAGAQPIIGYNYGAGSPGRVRGTLMTAAAAGTIVCVASWFVILVAARPLVALFQPDPRTVELGSHALRIFFALLPLVGIQVIGTGYFQAVGKAGISFFNNLLRQILLIVPLLIVLPRILGLDGLWYANPISDLGAAIAVCFFIAAELRGLRSRKAEISAKLPVRR